MERLYPGDGDVLVSHPMARVECEIAVVPRPAHAVHERQEAAIEHATQLARTLGVDAWITLDRRHFLRLASFRPTTAAPRGDPAVTRREAHEAAPH
jgi:hypothetical protein